MIPWLSLRPAGLTDHPGRVIRSPGAASRTGYLDRLKPGAGP